MSSKQITLAPISIHLTSPGETTSELPRESVSCSDSTLLCPWVQSQRRVSAEWVVESDQRHRTEAPWLTPEPWSISWYLLILLFWSQLKHSIHDKITKKIIWKLFYSFSYKVNKKTVKWSTPDWSSDCWTEKYVDVVLPVGHLLFLIVWLWWNLIGWCWGIRHCAGGIYNHLTHYEFLHSASSKQTTHHMFSKRRHLIRLNRTRK